MDVEDRSSTRRIGRRRYAALILAIVAVSLLCHLIALRVGGSAAVVIESATLLCGIWPSWRISVARARDAGRGPGYVLRIYGVVLASITLASASTVVAAFGLVAATLAIAALSLALMAVALRMEATLVFARGRAAA